MEGEVNETDGEHPSGDRDLQKGDGRLNGELFFALAPAEPFVQVQMGRNQQQGNDSDKLRFRSHYFESSIESQEVPDGPQVCFISESVVFDADS